MLKLTHKTINTVKTNMSFSLMKSIIITIIALNLKLLGNVNMNCK